MSCCNLHISKLCYTSIMALTQHKSKTIFQYINLSIYLLWTQLNYAIICSISLCPSTLLLYLNTSLQVFRKINFSIYHSIQHLYIGTSIYYILCTISRSCHSYFCYVITSASHFVTPDLAPRSPLIHIAYFQYINKNGRMVYICICI